MSDELSSSSSNTNAVRPGRKSSLGRIFGRSNTALKTALPAADVNLTTCSVGILVLDASTAADDYARSQAHTMADTVSYEGDRSTHLPLSESLSLGLHILSIIVVLLLHHFPSDL